MIRKAAWFLFFVVMAASCLEEPDCFSLNNNFVGISFKKLSDKKADTLAFASVTATGTDSVFYSSALVTGANLPLDYYANETVYTFEGIDQPYTLTFDYSVKPQFVSEQCGHRFVLENLSVASTGFDSIRLITTTPHGRFSSGVTVEVYRCPNTSRLKIHFAEPVGISNIATDYPATILLTSQSVSSMLLPLNAAASQSTIDFTFSDGTTKRLVIGYKNEQHTLFKTCGPQQVLSEFKIVETDFTSVSVLKTTIEDPNKTNLEIVL